MRAFILLCVDIATSTSDLHIGALLIRAIKRGIIKIETNPTTGDGTPCLTEEIAWAYVGKSKNLRHIVKALAQVITGGEPFWIAIDEGITFINSDTPGLTTPRKPKEINIYTVELWTADGTPVPPLIKNEEPLYSITRNELTDMFFYAVNLYMRKRGLTWSKLPLKKCEYCDTIFFGKRDNQRFCSKNHGQRWHAEQSYKRKIGQIK